MFFSQVASFDVVLHHAKKLETPAESWHSTRYVGKMLSLRWLDSEWSVSSWFLFHQIVEYAGRWHIIFRRLYFEMKRIQKSPISIAIWASNPRSCSSYCTIKTGHEVSQIWLLWISVLSHNSLPKLEMVSLEKNVVLAPHTMKARGRQMCDGTWNISTNILCLSEGRRGGMGFWQQSQKFQKNLFTLYSTT